MNTPKSPRARPGPIWAQGIFWTFAAVALVLLLAEHRAHAWGLVLHALLALCFVLLYLVVREDAGDDGDPSH